VTVEDCAQADAGLHEHDQGKQPERELVSAIGIFDALGKKLAEHGDSFGEAELHHLRPVSSMPWLSGG
jgi:hypothetical protein